MVESLPDGTYAVGGDVDGVARVEVFSAEGAPLWAYDHDPIGGGAGPTTVNDLAAVGDTHVLGTVSRTVSEPGFVFLLNLDSHDADWNQYVDLPYIDYPDPGDLSAFFAQGPLAVAAMANEELAVVIAGSEFDNLFLTMGLDPDTGERTWLDSVYATWFWSNGLVANDEGGWFAHVSSYSALGAGGHRTHRWMAETGSPVEMPSGPGSSGSPGWTAGAAMVRSDGALVVPLRENSPVATSIHVVTQLPDGSSAGELFVPVDGRPSVRDAAVDSADRVYMLTGYGSRTVVRFDPDVSAHEVFMGDSMTSLRGIATTPSDGVVVLGTDGAPFLAELCPA